jgi:hypothetical protein
MTFEIEDILYPKMAKGKSSISTCGIPYQKTEVTQRSRDALFSV